jgi:hypothetical protein
LTNAYLSTVDRLGVRASSCQDPLALLDRDDKAAAFEDAKKRSCFTLRLSEDSINAKQGRLVVDEPTDLPEGTEVELATMEDEPWELTREQRAELEVRLATASCAELVPAAEVFARLRGG